MYTWKEKQRCSSPRNGWKKKERVANFELMLFDCWFMAKIMGGLCYLDSWRLLPLRDSSWFACWFCILARPRFPTSSKPISLQYFYLNQVNFSLNPYFRTLETQPERLISFKEMKNYVTWRKHHEFDSPGINEIRSWNMISWKKTNDQTTSIDKSLNYS